MDWIDMIVDCLLNIYQLYGRCYVDMYLTRIHGALKILVHETTKRSNTRVRENLIHLKCTVKLAGPMTIDSTSSMRLLDRLMCLHE